MSKTHNFKQIYEKYAKNDNANCIMNIDENGKPTITILKDYYKIRDGFIEQIQREMDEYSKEKETLERKGMDATIYEGYLKGLNRALALLLIAEKENSNR